MSAFPPEVAGGTYALRGEKLKPLNSCPASSQPVVLAICGSLNPLHNAHIKLYETAKEALTARGDCGVLGGFFSPVGDAYGKPGLKPAAQRVRIIEDAVRTHADLDVDTWECMQPTYTRTFYVLQQLEEHVKEWYTQRESEAVQQQLSRHGRHVRVVLVCGADLFSSFWVPGCWPLDLLKLLLDTFSLVVVYRSAGGDVGSVKDLEQRCQTSPVLRETLSSGETRELDLRGYAFTFAQFRDADDTSSTAVREVAMAMAAADPTDSAARARLREQLYAMVPSGALASVLLCYGGGDGATGGES